MFLDFKKFKKHYSKQYSFLYLYFFKDELEEDASHLSKYFKVGDYVDIKDYHYGSWFLAKITKIKKDKSPNDKHNDPKSPVQNDGLIYVAELDGFVPHIDFKLKFEFCVLNIKELILNNNSY